MRWIQNHPLYRLILGVENTRPIHLRKFTVTMNNRSTQKEREELEALARVGGISVGRATAALTADCPAWRVQMKEYWLIQVHAR